MLQLHNGINDSRIAKIAHALQQVVHSVASAKRRSAT
jgi:hypothetical protein